ncbi:MAG: phage tail assembly protein [Leptolyngbya sp.]|nr:phage tail assembly protein [Leptolyngbya sp.]
MSFSLPPTEFSFELPRGLVGGDGVLRREGTMRLATARDEMTAVRNPQAHTQPGYGDLVMLSQVITRLGDLTDLAPATLEDLFTVDLAYLREFYNRINQSGEAHISAQCPQCQHAFKVGLVLAGEW